MFDRCRLPLCVFAAYVQAKEQRINHPDTKQHPPLPMSGQASLEVVPI